MRLRVPEQADVADFGRGDQVNHGVYHAQASPEHRHNGQLLPGQDLNLGHTDGSLHLSCLHGEIPGGLIAHEGGDFADQLPELLDAGVFTPQDGELVLDQRVIQNVYMVHHSLSFLSAA